MIDKIVEAYEKYRFKKRFVLISGINLPVLALGSMTSLILLRAASGGITLLAGLMTKRVRLCVVDLECMRGIRAPSWIPLQVAKHGRL